MTEATQQQQRPRRRRVESYSFSYTDSVWDDEKKMEIVVMVIHHECSQCHEIVCLKWLK